ncbi:MAG TPA: leucine-rich repeat domain-containing protein [Bacteroidales bacterium]|jgi:Leucine-rich repeat (LRR) protein|nr:leucine-rich repeat domain-containing protein [Bacteroidales bacterium]
MNTSELHNKIKEAYSNQNLNKITVTLINLYKEQQFGTLRQIAEMISESVEIPYESDSKAFSKMMMLYHPDRGDFHRNEIDRLAQKNDHDGLLNYAHILMLGKIEEIAATLSSYEDIDYSPVYEWDLDLNDFTIINTRANTSAEEVVESSAEINSDTGYTFYEGIQRRMFGDTSIGFPPYYLENLDEFELSQSGIRDLDGIQYCVHAVVMDLSENLISDISLLWDLTQLEELNLSGNFVEEIDPIVNLRNLKTLDLSHNGVRDVSYLLHLPKLEYVDLTGTRVTQSQINKLEASGVTVVF